MHHHVIVFRWKPEADPEAIRKLADGLRDLAASLPGVVSYACGTDLGMRTGNDDFGISAVFESADALQTYLDHPTHRGLVSTYASLLLADKHGLQFAEENS
ncbi:Stress responsive A/B Barrel Domain [Nocardioides alpinus]|uniref:Stress responsive A/B Barrel Domain n=1 Tax=Nocardioides alpinus TaxID=748909 RepID=A0A1I0YA96_9ACTN|nr:Dabb family protein [Nocardioides alpinus]PKH38976.1 hypothetical protein CXG46_14700 [Nocardioides alpinus]SFB09727.1 Stress responsive A/B Barrel Domain [Nocardioides alpinus]